MDNNMDSTNFQNIMDSIEQDYNVKKVKDSILLLKRKVCKTHDLIKQYSEYIKEIDHLKLNLETVKKEAKHTISNYKSAMDKIRELELKIVEDKLSSEKLKNKINEYEINIAADKQTIQQLTCKIKNLEDERSVKVMEYELQKSSFEDKIKDLECEIKKLKMIPLHKKKEKKIVSSEDFDTAKPSTSTKSSSDIDINVSLCELSTKCEVQDKNIMTDEFYNIKDDPYPLFCAKCEAHLPSDLTPEQICKTMSVYPKLIEKDLSPPPKRIYSPPYSLLSTYPDFTNEDALSRISMPHLNPHSPYSESIVGNSKPQSERSSVMTQMCENVELRNVDISRIPVIPSVTNNLDSISTALTLSQNRSYVRENFCSDDLLVKHSSSIKEMERKIRSLESKMKKFRRLKEKVDNNSCCHRYINYKEDVLLNSNLISVICKSMAEYYDKKRETCSTNKQDINSEKCACSTKKAKLKSRQQLNKSNACRNTCSCKIENHDEKYQVRDMFCNDTENAINILQCEHMLPVHKNNSLSDINTSSTSLKDTDESDKREFVLHKKSILNSAEVASIEDSLTTSRLSADEILYASDNSLNKDDIEAIDMNNKTRNRISLSNDENFTDHTDDKVVNINAEINEIKSKGQNIHEDKVDKIYANDNLLNKDNVEAIDMDNQIETETIFLSNKENSTDHTDDKVDIKVEKNEIKSKNQNIYKDKIGEIYSSDDLLSNDNIETIGQTKTERTFLSDNENSTDHADSKIIDINAAESIIKSEAKNIDKDKISKMYASDNSLSKNDVEAINISNQTKIGRTSLSKENSTADKKIIHINAEESKIKRKVKDKVGDRILKKIRSLKRKTQANLRTNKQENIELLSYSDSSFEHNELTKRSRIKNREESSDRSLRSTNLKRNLDTSQESINEQEDNKLCSDDYKPAKKLRIAHTPKTSVPQLNSSIDFTHKIVKNIAFLATRKSNGNQQLNTYTRENNLLIESKKSPTINKKCDEKNIKSSKINSINRKPVNEKDLDLTSTEDCPQNNNIALSAMNIERVSEFEKCDGLIKDTIDKNILMDGVIGETSSNERESNVSHNNIANDTANDLELEDSIPLRTCVITQSESSTLCKDSYMNRKYDSLTEALETIKFKKEMSITELEYAYEALGNKSHDDHKISKDAILNGESLTLHYQSNVSEATRNESHSNSDVSTTEVLCSLRDSGIIVEDYTNDNNMKEFLDEIKNTDKQEETCANNKTIEVQAIKIEKRDVCVSKKQDKEKSINVSDEEEFQTPMSQLTKYIDQKHIKKYKLSLKQIKYIRKMTDKFVKKQLQKLIDSAWEENIHDDIVEKLGSTCGPRIIAKCIVEFLMEEVDHEVLDKSFTPPAPLMTTFEQKIVILLIDLEVLKPTVIYFVQAAIEYNLFRLNSDVGQRVDSLTRIYVVLSRIQKDREKIRIMCCNALYCMGLKSMNVLYTVLIQCWPEVLPNAENNKGILPKCIAFLIYSQQIENAKQNLKRSEQRLKALKNYVSRFYNYTIQETTSDIVKELMIALKAEQIDGLNTAIILIAKKEGPSWTYTNIIKSALLPMIIKNEHPCVYSAFSLLGKLLRAFPLQDENNIVKDISEQLCDLIKSGQGSHDQQEGIISAMLSLSRHTFNIVAPFVIRWMPSKPLRPIINMQLQAFINARNSRFWKNYLKSLQTNSDITQSNM